ncbi:MAG: hypothetical protein WA021_02595 [Minisyncoccia bacterium]
MTNRALFYIQALLLALIAIVHAFALMHDLYWYYPLLNRAAHFSGGLWVALATIWLLAHLAREFRFVRVMTIVVLVSIAWEIFEVAIGMTHEQNYVLDTSLDLIMDTLGGMCGFFIARRMVQSRNNGSQESNPS